MTPAWAPVTSEIYGLSYLSPIGPLQIGVGWKLDREPGEDGARVFVSVGHPF